MGQPKRIVLPLFVLVLLLFSWASPVDELATRQLDAGLKRALVSFATARSLNGSISVAQDTQVAIVPAGIGITLAPGQILDPVNDLVEQFSLVTLIASVALGAEKVLLVMATNWLMSALLSAVAVLCLMLHWDRRAVPLSLSRILLLLIVLRLGFPVVTLGADALFQEYLLVDYFASQKSIAASSSQVQALVAPAIKPPDPQMLLEKLQGAVAPDVNVSAYLEALVKVAEPWPEQMMRLMVIFLLQIVILPLVLLWGFVATLRAILGSFAGLAPNPPK